MDNPKFSVCIPNYNYADYVGETIESVLNQEYQNFEIVVTDNASTDDSVEVVKSFSSDKIRLFCNNYNVGFAPNLQRSTALAQGDFLILLSSDDLMRPGALQAYCDIIEKQGERASKTVLYSAADVIDSNGRTTEVLFKPRGQIFNRRIPVASKVDMELDGTFEVSSGWDVLRQAITEARYPGVFCATAYPRQMWEAVEGYDTTYHIAPDAAFLHKLLALDPDYTYVRRRLFAYRVHDSNQLARVKSQRAMRLQVDGYMRTVNYPQEVLEDLGISRQQLVHAYLNTLCFRESWIEMAHGSWLQALKIFTFALASYPTEAPKLPYTYVTGLLLAMGPIGRFALKGGQYLRDLAANDSV